MPYALRIENTSGYGMDCHFCNNHMCRTACPLPYSSNHTVLDYLHKVGVEDNISFYQSRGGKSDLILQLHWHSDFDKSLQRHLSGVVDMAFLDEKAKVFEERENSSISIDDCFNEFKREEMLDEDNKWYCNKCKDHVQATKQLEIFKLPPILIINLKRFKQGRAQMRFMGMMGGGAGQKIDVDIDFPLSGLDLSEYVKGSPTQSGQQMIYDCYAVSNHYGNMGFGHYTAFAVNPQNKAWYEFDDSRVTQISEHQVKQQVVSSAAYNLFYRRRDWHENNLENGVEFDNIALKPDLDMINKK